MCSALHQYGPGRFVQVSVGQGAAEQTRSASLRAHRGGSYGQEERPDSVFQFLSKN